MATKCSISRDQAPNGRFLIPLFCLLVILSATFGSLLVCSKPARTNDQRSAASIRRQLPHSRTLISKIKVLNAQATTSSTRNALSVTLGKGVLWLRHRLGWALFSGSTIVLALLAGRAMRMRRLRSTVPENVPLPDTDEENARLRFLLEGERKREKQREDLYWKMAMNATDVLYIMYPGEGTIEWYGQIDKMLGYTQNSFPRTVEAWADSIHPEESERIITMYKDSCRTGQEFKVEYRMRHRNGSYRDWSHRGRPIFGEQQDLLSFIGACADVTERNSAQRKIRDSEDRLARILEINADAILLCDRAGCITFANRAAELLFGTGRNNIVGQPYDGGSWTITNNNGEALPQSEQPLARVLDAQDDMVQVEHCIEQSNGKITVVLVNGALLCDEKSEVSGTVLSITDITGRKAAEDRLAWQAFHDPLTGLPNRALFMDRLTHALTRAARSGARIAVFFLDLDNFKKTNDSLGHDAGDELLRTTAQRLQQALRASDTAARLGGDEFVLLLENIAMPSNVQIVADRVLDALLQPVMLKNASVVAPPSIGIALSTPNCTPVELLGWADAAMYVAKTNGKGRYEFHDECCAPEHPITATETSLTA